MCNKEITYQTTAVKPMCMLLYILWYVYFKQLE